MCFTWGNKAIYKSERKESVDNEYAIKSDSRVLCVTINCKYRSKSTILHSYIIN